MHVEVVKYIYHDKYITYHILWYFNHMFCTRVCILMSIYVLVHGDFLVYVFSALSHEIATQEVSKFDKNTLKHADTQEKSGWKECKEDKQV